MVSENLSAERSRKAYPDSGLATARDVPPTLDQLWESLAGDIHANGMSVRDALAFWRGPIEQEARSNSDQLREALRLLVRDVIEAKSQDTARVGQYINWGEVNVSLDRAEQALAAPVEKVVDGEH